MHREAVRVFFVKHLDRKESEKIKKHSSNKNSVYVDFHRIY